MPRFGNDDRDRASWERLKARWAEQRKEQAMDIATHPVQTKMRHNAVCPQVVTLAAYEVYTHCFGKQPALIEGECRGGFGAGELIAFLYARSFPVDQWRTRVDEALTGMKNL